MGICLMPCGVKCFNPRGKDHSSHSQLFLFIFCFKGNAEIAKASGKVQYLCIQHYTYIGVLFAGGNSWIYFAACTEWIDPVKLGYHTT